MLKNQKSYPEDFQREAVKLALRSPSISKTAKELGIPISTLHTWLKKPNQVSRTNSTGQVLDLNQELHNLRKENARLREEKEILKKAAAYFARETK